MWLKEMTALPVSSFSFLMDSGLYQSLFCLKLWKLTACPEGLQEGQGPAISSYFTVEEQLIQMGLSPAVLNKFVLTLIYLQN